MDDVQQVAGTISDALQTIGHEFSSVRLLSQFGLILLAAAIGTVAATLIRRRIDLNALTLGWPPFLQTAARLLLANLGTMIFVLTVVLMRAAMLSLDLDGPFLSARRRSQPRHRMGGDRAGRRTDPQPVRLPAGGVLGLDHRRAQYSRPASSRPWRRSIRSRS